MSWRSQVIADILTLAGLLTVIGLLLGVHFRPPLITKAGPLPINSLRSLTVGVTTGATLFTMVVTGRIRHGFLRSFEPELRGLRENLLAQSSTEESAQEKLKSMDREWRGALGIDSFSERCKNFRPMLTFTLCGLITASIVTSLSPTLAEHVVSYSPLIPDSGFGEYRYGREGLCLGIAPSFDAVWWGTGWAFENGSVFYGAVSERCPPGQVKTLAPGINYQDILDHAYADAGVAVERTAIGAPMSIYNQSKFQNISNEYGMSLARTQQCVPVMVSNPVKCKREGNLTILSERTARLSTGDKGQFTWPATYARNLTKDSVMIAHLWTKRIETQTGEKNIGLAKLAIGAYTDPRGATPYASDLAKAFNEPDKSIGLEGNSTYVVTCDINPQNSFEYRTVTLDLRANSKQRGSNLAYYLSGGDVCKPTNPTISNVHFATAGLANYLILSERADGYFVTISQSTGFNRGPPYAFNNSENALEDVLGLITALAVSRLPSQGQVVAHAEPGRGGEAYAVVEVTRLGSEGWQSILLVIPPLCAFIILAVFFKMSFRRDWRVDSYESSQVHGDEDRKASPYMFAAESLYELINLKKSGKNDEKSTGAFVEEEEQRSRVFDLEVDELNEQDGHEEYSAG